MEWLKRWEGVPQAVLTHLEAMSRLAQISFKSTDPADQPAPDDPTLRDPLGDIMKN